MERINNKVIVWGSDNYNTLGLIRGLGIVDVDLLFLIKGRAGFATKSKYCKKYVETDSIEIGYKYLLENFLEEKNKPIIITPSDEIIIFIDSHKEELEKLFIIPGTTEKGKITKYIDKNAMTSLAKEIGILCPKSIKVKKNSDITAVEYPCLIKPSHEKPGHYNEFKFKICKNEKALKKTLRYVRSDSEFILQQYIPKKLELLVYGGRMWDDNTIIAGALIRDRMAGTGSSHGYLTGEIPEYVDISKITEFLKRIDYHGLFAFEYGLLDDKAYFFEVNLRNDATFHYFYQAGANIPLAYVYSSAGADYSTIPTKLVAEKKWFIDELFDVENVVSGKVKRKKWKQDMAEATIFKYYDKNDITPYEIAKKGKTKQIMQDIILKRFRLYIVFILDKLGLRK